MIAFVPVAAFPLYVPFDSTFVYLGYLPDLYIIPEPDGEYSDKGSSFSIGRLYFPFHRSFGIGVRKPRFIADPYSRYMKYMGNDYLLSEVKCLNIRHYVRCWFSSQLPINQSEIEKVLMLERVCKEIDNDNLKDSLKEVFPFTDFLIAGTNRNWGRYLCFTPKDQEAVLSCVSNPSGCQELSVSMMPVASFYRSSIEPDFTDLEKESFWLTRLSLSSYFSLGNIYRN